MLVSNSMYRTILEMLFIPYTDTRPALGLAYSTPEGYKVHGKDQVHSIPTFSWKPL